MFSKIQWKNAKKIIDLQIKNKIGPALGEAVI